MGKASVGESHRLAPRNKAGRKVSVAIAVGVALGAIVLLGLFIPYAWYPLISVAAWLATAEVCRRLKENGYEVTEYVMLFGGQAMIWLSWPYGASGMLSGYIVSIGAVMVARLFQHGTATAPRNYLRDMAVCVFVLTWIPLCAACGANLTLYHDASVSGTFLIITFMLCVVANDVGGFAAGVFFGKHPMAPAVSPKKSWEGFVGSLTFSALVGIVATVLLLHRNPLMGVVVGVSLACAATLGDLVESQFKRDLGIKDMGTMLPEHGGLMDRLDSMLPAAAMTWVLVTVLELM